MGTPSQIFSRLQGGDRSALAQAITLVESDRPADRELAGSLLELCLPASGNGIRIGITGIPGVGKSTFIDALGMEFIANGHRPAVLAVDPSSTRSGGSILGDKTRMNRLSVHPDAFIRPTPTSGELGGVARRTRETMLLCEAAGFDRLLIETVGIGQNELDVEHIADIVVLLMIPGMGDELQGIKRGIMAAADLIVVNKTDSGVANSAKHTISDLQAALQLLPTKHGRKADVRSCSALTGEGIPELTAWLEERAAQDSASGILHAERKNKAVELWRTGSRKAMLDHFTQDPRIASAMHDLEEKVLSGTLDPYDAAQRLIQALRKDA